MMNPRQELVEDLNKKIDLFQTTIGKAQTNTTATTTMILDSLAQTVLAQYDEIEQKNLEIANLQSQLKENTPIAGPMPTEGEPDPVLT